MSFGRSMCAIGKYQAAVETATTGACKTAQSYLTQACQFGCALLQCACFELIEIFALDPCMVHLTSAQCQSAAHRLWIVTNGVLLNLHMATRTVMNKLAPSFFAPPLVPMLQGSAPYRKVTSDMHTDGMLWAGVLAITAAGFAHLLQ